MNKISIVDLERASINLLKDLIATPSFSKEEDATASIIEHFLHDHNVVTGRLENNIWAKNLHFDSQKPIIMLNSHHDTVKPNPQYTRNAFEPIEEDGRLYGLGSNDAGGCLVSLIATFLYYYEAQDLPYNLVLAATAEEEISGKQGIELLLKDESFLKDIDHTAITCGIVGEPTLMQLAIAERGLLVLDGYAPGKAGHAARAEGENAILKAMQDIQWFSTYQFEKVSDVLGPVKMNVTVIETENKAHNMIPSVCHYVVDVRVNECYTFEEVLTVIQQHTLSDVQPRSLRMKSSGIALSHPLIASGLALGRTYYGSPTTSDKALMPFKTLKMGPGDSARSHSADEYIYIDEIKEGIDLYIKLLAGVTSL